jgi:DNA-binding NarL/FixJ family response regulator
MIRILIADDHTIVRQGVSRVISLSADLQLADEAKDADELLAKLETLQVDLVLTDMSMPGPGGVELIRQIKQRYPALPILVMSMHSERQIAAEAIKAGASGYLTKDCEPEILLQAIRRCAGGGHYISAELASLLLFGSAHHNSTALPHQELSERELQIFLLLAAGKTVSDIAKELFISSKTVSTHKHRLMQKMSVESLSELIRYALKHGLLQQ